MPDNTAVSRGELLQLRDVVQAHVGIRVEEAKLGFLADRLAALVKELGEPSLFSLNVRLMREMGTAGSAAWTALLPLVTINETYFFREVAQLETLRATILPALVRGKADRTVRILSAPCSSGEEPYTVAMMLDEAPGALAGCRLEIWGIDVDPVVIARAREGLYPRSAFRTTDGAYLSRYFRADGDAWRVGDRLAGRVRFQRGNLLEPREWPAGVRFDVVLCRNMLIYFDRATQRRIASQIQRSLTPGGVLLIGNAETLHGQDVGLTTVSGGGSLYYVNQPESARAGA